MGSRVLRSLEAQMTAQMLYSTATVSASRKFWTQTQLRIILVFNLSLANVTQAYFVMQSMINLNSILNDYDACTKSTLHLEEVSKLTDYSRLFKMLLHWGF